MKLHIKLSIPLFVLLTAFSCIDNEPGNIDPQPEEEKSILEEHQSNLQYVEVTGNTLAYLEYGKESDETLLLLHGIPTSSLLYRKVAKEISEQTGYRVIALDLLGFGDSDKPDQKGAYTIANQSQRVYDFVSALNIDHFVLGIHDLGGIIGWQMFLDSEMSKIDGLLVTNTALGFDGFTPPSPVAPIFAGQITPRDQFIKLLIDSDSQRQMTFDFIDGGIVTPNLFTEELLDAYTAGVTQPEAYIETFESVNIFTSLIPEIKSVLKDFTKPKTILWGGKDLFLSAEIMGTNIKNDLNVSDSDFVVLPDAGHFLQEDAPTEYIDHVSTFLSINF